MSVFLGTITCFCCLSVSILSGLRIFDDREAEESFYIYRTFCTFCIFGTFAGFKIFFVFFGFLTAIDLIRSYNDLYRLKISPCLDMNPIFPWIRKPTSSYIWVGFNSWIMACIFCLNALLASLLKYFLLMFLYWYI